MEDAVAYKNDMNLMVTELRLGLPGTEMAVTCTTSNKRPWLDARDECGTKARSDGEDPETSPAFRGERVGWPPIQSYRKNSLQKKKKEAASLGIYVKVGMDGAPYLRKIDLKVYRGYLELLKALENMFKFTIGEYSEREGYKDSEYAPTYEDKDGDWMLVGDVPWDMFMSSCKRLRIMRKSEAKGLCFGA